MTDTVRKGLLSAYRRLMEPLVRILIRHGVSYGEVNEVLKNIFVDVAERDFTLPNRRPSQSRIAILTGLNRKEVAKQKALLDAGDRHIPSNLNRVIRVIEGWHSDPEFTGPYGMPIELPFDADGGAASFTELVKRYSGDMGPRAMLDELLRVGAVERLATGSFRILTRAYIPETLHPDALERFGAVVRNFVTTLEFNMEKAAPGAGRFERIVVADAGLKKELLPAFDRLLRIKGQQLLVELDNWLTAQEPVKATERESQEERIKTGVGIYHFLDEE